MTVKELMVNIEELLVKGKITEDAEIKCMIVSNWGNETIEEIRGNKRENTLQIW